MVQRRLSMTKEELERIIRYVNNNIKEYICTDDYYTHIAIQNGFFDEQEFIKNGIVELDN